MANFLWYGKALEGQYSATAARRIDWVGDTIKCSLLTSSYTPDQDAHDFWDDLSANVLAGGSYADVTLAGKSVSYIAGSNTIALIATDPAFVAFTGAFRYAALWKDTGAAATSPVLGYADLGAQSLTATAFTIDGDGTNGLLKIVAS